MVFNYIRAVKILPVFLSFELFLSLNFLPPVQAQDFPETKEIQDKSNTRVRFTPLTPQFAPQGEGAPDGSASGGSRDDEVLTLLLPTKYGALGLTTKEKPVFFFHVTSSKIKEVYFSLQDQETQEIIYETSIKLSRNPGVIGIRLPADAPSLEVGKTYLWGINPLQGTSSKTEVGLITRVELNPTMNSQLESANPLDQAVFYAENGIWLDTLEVLAELKRSQPENAIYEQEWTELLKSVGLDDIATQPLVE